MKIRLAKLMALLMSLSMLFTSVGVAESGVSLATPSDVANQASGNSTETDLEAEDVPTAVDEDGWLVSAWEETTTFTYNGEAQYPKIKVVSIEDEDAELTTDEKQGNHTISYEFSTSAEGGFGAEPYTNAGKYYVRATVTNTVEGENYGDEKKRVQSYEIEQATVSEENVTVVGSLTANASMTYGDSTVPTLTPDDFSLTSVVVKPGEGEKTDNITANAKVSEVTFVEQPTNAGLYDVNVTVSITGAANYAGATVTVVGKDAFKVNPKSIADETLTGKTDEEIIFNGAEQYPTDPSKIVLTGSEATFDLGDDWTPVGTDCKSATTQTAQVSVTGNGNYTGKMTLTVEYTISPFSLDGADALIELDLDPDGYTYDGTEHKPAVKKDSLTVKGITGTLVDGTDYTADVAYASNENAGTAVVTITVTGQGNLSDNVKITKDFQIDKAKLEDLDAAAEYTGDPFTYTGEEQVPAKADVKVTFTGDKAALITEADYEITSITVTSGGTNAGEAEAEVTITATESGNFTGSQTATVKYKINPFELDGKTLPGTFDNEVYTGTAFKPEFKETEFEIDGVEIPDAKLGYNYPADDMIDVGSYDITAALTTDNENFTGTATVKGTFRITAAKLPEATASYNGDALPYNGKDQTPSLNDIEITFDGVDLVREKDYTVDYADNSGLDLTNADTKTVNLIVTGKGNYEGDTQLITVEYDIAKVDLSVIAPKLVLEKDSFIYTGSAIEPSCSIEFTTGDRKAPADTEVDIRLVGYTNAKGEESHTDVGDSTVTVTYTIAALGDCVNYTTTEPIELTATFDITPAALPAPKSVSVDLDATAFVYNGQKQAPDYEKDQVLVDFTGSDPEVTAEDFDVKVEADDEATDAGEHTVTVTLTGKRNFEGTQIVEQVKYTIARADVQVIAPAVAWKQEPRLYTYNGQPIEPLATDYEISFTSLGDRKAPAAEEYKITAVYGGDHSDVGDCTVTYTIEIKEDVVTNYTGKAVLNELTFSIVPATFEIKSVKQDVSYVYDGAEHYPKADELELVIVSADDPDRVLIEGKEYEVEVKPSEGVDTKNAGEGKEVTITITGVGNFEGPSQTTFAKYEIKKAQLADIKPAVTLKATQYTYTGKPIEPGARNYTVSFGKNGDMVPPAAEEYEITAVYSEGHTNVGKYTVTYTVTAKDACVNYESSVKLAALDYEIIPLEVTLTVLLNGQANAYSKVYDGKPVTITWTADPGFYPATDGNSIKFYEADANGQATSVEATPYTDHCEHVITATLDNPNYVLKPVNAALTIEKRALTVTGKTTKGGEKDATITYGDATPVFEAVWSCGEKGAPIVAGDEATVLSAIAMTIQATEDTAINAMEETDELLNAGAYDVEIEVLKELDNYTITVEEKLPSVTVEKKKVTLTMLVDEASEAQRTYGDAMPAVSYGFAEGDIVEKDGEGPLESVTWFYYAAGAEGEDLVDEDGNVLNAAVDVKPGTAVGCYKTGATCGDENYDMTVVPALLTIVKRPVKIAADAQSKYMGTVDPKLTYAYGPVAADGESAADIAAVFAADEASGAFGLTGTLVRAMQAKAPEAGHADDPEWVGVYAITAGTLGLTEESTNYAVQVIEASELTISYLPETAVPAATLSDKENERGWYTTDVRLVAPKGYEIAYEPSTASEDYQSDLSWPDTSTEGMVLTYSLRRVTDGATTDVIVGPSIKKDTVPPTAKVQRGGPNIRVTASDAKVEATDRKLLEVGLFLVGNGGALTPVDGMVESEIDASEYTASYLVRFPGTYAVRVTDVSGQTYVSEGMYFADSDGDGVNNDYEIQQGSDPENPDTDGDGLSDYDELIRYGSDPTSSDTDHDGVPDADEIQYGLNIKSADTDGDGVGDADYLFLLLNGLIEKDAVVPASMRLGLYDAQLRQGAGETTDEAILTVGLPTMERSLFLTKLAGEDALDDALDVRAEGKVMQYTHGTNRMLVLYENYLCLVEIVKNNGRYSFSIEAAVELPYETVEELAFSVTADGKIAVVAAWANGQADGELIIADMVNGVAYAVNGSAGTERFAISDNGANLAYVVNGALNTMALDASAAPTTGEYEGDMLQYSADGELRTKSEELPTEGKCAFYTEQLTTAGCKVKMMNDGQQREIEIAGMSAFINRSKTMLQLRVEGAKNLKNIGTPKQLYVEE